MRKMIYLAIFEPTQTGFSVYFPDLPGCVSYGDNFEMAQKEAVDALSLHIYGMEKDGEEIPKPSDRPIVDPETASGYFVSPITIFPDMVKNELDNKKTATNVTLPIWLKEIAEKNKVNYSKILEEALVEYLGINTSLTQS